MSDEASFTQAEEQRQVLRKIIAYRALRKSVRSGASGSLIFGGIMLAVWYYAIFPGMRFNIFSLVYLVLAIMEFGTGVLNFFFPSAEGVLLSGVVLTMFGGWSVVREALIFQNVLPGRPFIPLFVLGIFWFFSGVRTVRSYFTLRKQFGQRPTSEHLRWFNDLLLEIRASDPETDPQALDIPTRPRIQMKLLGETVVLLFPDGEVDVLSHEQVEIELHEHQTNPDRIMASLFLNGVELKPFPITRANWENYLSWKDSGDNLPEAHPVARQPR